MQTATEQRTTLGHAEIAVVANDLWKKEGCQSGRDIDYWLRAEQQLLALNHKGQAQPGEAAARGKVSAATGRASAIQPAAPAGSRASNLRKRKSVNF
jgi:hypothetical protein